MREALNLKKSIRLSTEENCRDFIIEGVVGYGASCIVYDALFFDDLDLPHKVRLKECFPVGYANENRVDGSIEWSSDEKQEKARTEFIKTYRKQVILQGKIELVNSTNKIMDSIYQGNNTLYIVMEYGNGCSYDKRNLSSLYEVFKVLTALSKTVGKYHELGFLHLDIKPENFMTIPETEELVKLFDFDSIVSLSAIKNGIANSISYSFDWAAPEVKRCQLSKISEKSDIYSIGAVLYWSIFDKKYKSMDRLAISSMGFDTITLFDNVNPQIKKALTRFFNKTLAASPNKRYSNMEEVIKALEELVILSDPSRVYLCESIPKQINRFDGRESELNKIDDILSKRNICVISGIGGVGKSELSIQYAIRERDFSDPVVWVKVRNTIEGTLESGEICLYGIDDSLSSNDILKQLRGLVSKDTLFILDDVKDFSDKYLMEMLELPCKFLLTSRINPGEFFGRDSIVRLDCLDDSSLFRTFRYYYPLALSVNEESTIIDIIHKLGNYTLAIPIIAKNMALEVTSPSEMLVRIEKSGYLIKNGKVSHYKDGEIIEASVHEFISGIFNLVSISDMEMDVLCAMALLKGIRIGKKTLASWSNPKLHMNRYHRLFENPNENASVEFVNSLVKKGLLYYNDIMDQVTMHDVICDVVLSSYMTSSVPFLSYIDILCDDIKEWTKDEKYDGIHVATDANEYTVSENTNLVINVLSNLLNIKEDAKSYILSCIDKIKEFEPSFVEDLFERINIAEENEFSDMKIQYHRIESYIYCWHFIYQYRDEIVDAKYHADCTTYLEEGLREVIKAAKHYLSFGEHRKAVLYLYDSVKGIVELVNEYVGGSNYFTMVQYEKIASLYFEIFDLIIQNSEVNEELKNIIVLKKLILEKISEEKKNKDDAETQYDDDIKREVTLYTYYTNKVTKINPEDSELKYSTYNEVLTDDRLTNFEKEDILSFLDLDDFLTYVSASLYGNDVFELQVHKNKVLPGSIDRKHIISIFLWYDSLPKRGHVWDFGYDCQEKLDDIELMASGKHVFEAMKMLAALYEAVMIATDDFADFEVSFSHTEFEFSIFLDRAIEIAMQYSPDYMYPYLFNERKKIFNLDFSFSESVDVRSQKNDDKRDLFWNLIIEYLDITDSKSNESFIGKLAEYELDYPEEVIFFREALSEETEYKDLVLGPIYDPKCLRHSDLELSRNIEVSADTGLMNRIYTKASIIFQYVLMDNDEEASHHIEDYITYANDVLIASPVHFIYYLRIADVLRRLNKYEMADAIYNKLAVLIGYSYREYSYSKMCCMKPYLIEILQFAYNGYETMHPDESMQDIEKRIDEIESIYEKLSEEYEMTFHGQPFSGSMCTDAEEDNNVDSGERIEESEENEDILSEIPDLMTNCKYMEFWEKFGSYMKNDSHSLADRKSLIDSIYEKAPMLVQEVIWFNEWNAAENSSKNEISLALLKQYIDNDDFRNAIAIYKNIVGNIPELIDGTDYGTNLIGLTSLFSDVDCLIEIITDSNNSYWAVKAIDDVWKCVEKTNIIGWISEHGNPTLNRYFLKRVVEIVDNGMTLASEIGALSAFRRLEKTSRRIKNVGYTFADIECNESKEYVTFDICFERYVSADSIDDIEDLLQFIYKEHIENKTILIILKAIAKPITYNDYIMSDTGMYGTMTSEEHLARHIEAFEQTDDFVEQLLMTPTIYILCKNFNNVPEAINVYADKFKKLASLVFDSNSRYVLLSLYEQFTFYIFQFVDSEYAVDIYIKLAEKIKSTYETMSFYELSNDIKAFQRIYSILKGVVNRKYWDDYELIYKRFNILAEEYESGLKDDLLDMEELYNSFMETLED